MAKVETDNVMELEFKWGKKRGVGGKKKEVQFYESFTYDGVDYTLYDCVYMHKEGEPEPYIGKLIKIWENGDKTKKVKVQWFFRPSEISGWLGDERVDENEIFLASGEGVGLANVNSLEAIAGKCNVVCISKDSRNHQPSEEELKMADYIFYRTFDVGLCTVCDKMDDKVGGLEVKFVFHRKENNNTGGVPEPGLDKKMNEKYDVACNGKQQVSIKTSPDENRSVTEDGDHNQSLATNDVKDLSIKGDYVTEVKSPSGSPRDCSGLATTSVRQASASGQNITGGVAEFVKDEFQVVNNTKVKAEKRTIDGMEEKPTKKAKIENFVNLCAEKNSNNAQNMNVRGNDVKAMSTTCASEEITKSGYSKNPVGQGKRVKFDKEYDDQDDKPYKKIKVECPTKENNSNNSETAVVSSDLNCAKSLITSVTSNGEIANCEVNMDSFGLKSPSNKEKLENKTKRLPGNRMPKRPASDSPNVDRKTEGKIFEVTRKPEADNSKWFKPQPFETRIQDALKDGTLVLLLNLDPEYVSSEVEDIMWHAFKEHCTAKMLQRTSISAPHSGQAIVIFKSRESATKVLRELKEGCLMLPNMRPLVGTAGLPTFSGKQFTFYGHLVIDNKLQAQRDTRDAVSTSHCSQPNTIEYDMAMEWCLLQARSDDWWKRLYRQQGMELRKLKANFKSK